MSEHMDVSDVLQNISDRRKEAAALTDIERPLVLDAGLLTAWDPDSIVMPKAGTNREEYFRNLARDDVQVILNRLYTMEGTEVVEGERVLNLPEPTTILPRAKSVPKPKPPTKWEQFAHRKGIQSKSSKGREKSLFDEITQKWVPRHGYERAKNQYEKDWCIEVPDNADPNVDYFAKKSEEKKERIAKNKFQQLRNISRARGN